MSDLPSAIGRGDGGLGLTVGHHEHGPFPKQPQHSCCFQQYFRRSSNVSLPFDRACCSWNIGAGVRSSVALDLMHLSA